MTRRVPGARRPRAATLLLILLASVLGLLATVPAVAAPTAEPGTERPPVVNRQPPTLEGVARYGRVLVAGPGRWTPRPERVRYQWLRDGREIPGATHRRYRIAPGDVDHRLRVQVTAFAPGYTRASALSDRRPLVRHRVPARRVVTYSVTTRGRITTSVRVFRRQAQQTYDDARGWRGRGVVFRPVARGGDFTLVLAEARTVPSFSSECSAEWSCRVGRWVIINQMRWKHASPAWRAGRGSLRDYRHMVVNHETGHWLGKGHATCPAPGRPAPVMMQQSKDLGGCRFNPWPTLAELR